jgi:hypothetical protein
VCLTALASAALGAHQPPNLCRRQVDHLPAHGRGRSGHSTGKGRHPRQPLVRDVAPQADGRADLHAHAAHTGVG